MPHHTVGLLEIRIVHSQTSTDVHPVNFGDKQHDLRELWLAYLQEVEREGGVQTRERYFTVEAVGDVHGDTLCELDYGRFGSNRRVRDVHTGSLTGNVAHDEVASEALRLLCHVPTRGTVSYVAHEQVGINSVVGVLSHHFKNWFHWQCRGFDVEIAYVEDADAWKEFLDGATLRELTFVARKPADGNRAGRPTKEIYEVRPDGRGAVLPKSWLDRIRGGRLQANEVLSVQVNEADISETRVVVEKDKRRRTISIGSDWPRFTWEIEPGGTTRPSDPTFTAVAADIIHGHLARHH
ncbi:hypothetical protein ACFVTM_03980 [Arthrobacter sp. NPDC058130]|uniref:hypothetical protein n=1 Tax=Arthrobacter sp. NPDC058130 TaxID=3346353 RepID=UPI0036E2E6E7